MLTLSKSHYITPTFLFQRLEECQGTTNLLFQLILPVVYGNGVVVSVEPVNQRLHEKMC